MCDKFCVNCGSKGTHAKGRCITCYKYFWVHKVDRPLEFIERKAKRVSAPRWCKVCGHPALYRSFRCHACHDYYMRCRKERPRHLYVSIEDGRCANCGISALGVPRFRRGRCRRCYEYKMRHNTERPESLWGNGPFGYCECGQPANHMIDKFPLCDSCAVEYKKGAYS